MNDFDLQLKWLSGSQVEIQATDAGTLTGTEKVLIMDGTSPKETTTQDIANLGDGGGGSSYLVYVNKVSQIGTGNLTGTPLQNTLELSSWTRSIAGAYSADAPTSSFDLSKIWVGGMLIDSDGITLQFPIYSGGTIEASFKLSFADNGDGTTNIALDIYDSNGARIDLSDLDYPNLMLPEIRFYP